VVREDFLTENSSSTAKKDLKKINFDFFSAIGLLKQMLELDPDVRVTAEQALAHPYLVDYHDAADEPICELPYDQAFEELDIPIEEWKSECCCLSVCLSYFWKFWKFFFRRFGAAGSGHFSPLIMPSVALPLNRRGQTHFLPSPFWLTCSFIYFIVWAANLRSFSAKWRMFFVHLPSLYLPSTFFLGGHFFVCSEFNNLKMLIFKILSVEKSPSVLFVAAFISVNVRDFPTKMSALLRLLLVS
jgi:serine/threonine protein kinase